MLHVYVHTVAASILDSNLQSAFHVNKMQNRLYLLFVLSTFRYFSWAPVVRLHCLLLPLYVVSRYAMVNTRYFMRKQFHMCISFLGIWIDHNMIALCTRQFYWVNFVTERHFLAIKVCTERGAEVGRTMSNC